MLRIPDIRRWQKFWAGLSGPAGSRRLAAKLACWKTKPYHGRAFLSYFHPHGFVAPSACLDHPGLHRGSRVYIGDSVVVSRRNDGGNVELGTGVHLYGDTFLETGSGGAILIGSNTHVQPGCHLHAFLADIDIGADVEIASGCAFYSYDHGFAGTGAIMDQPLTTKGRIRVGSGAWLGHGVTVLAGARIGKGSVIAAGAVVAHTIPDFAIAGGVPAKVIKFRPGAPLPAKV